MTRNGQASERPTSAHPTGENAYSSSLGHAKTLPTPNAYLAQSGGSQHPDKRRAGGHSVGLTDVVEHLDVTRGAYGAALDQWANLTRPAPAPTRPRRDRRPAIRPA